MLKTQAINLLGGNVSKAAAAIGSTYQAVNKWPDVLSQRITDRVVGACGRLGIDVPADLRIAQETREKSPELATPSKETA